jgi:hypothetical protein
MRPGDGGMSLHEVEDKFGKEPFQPHLKPGQMPGQVRGTSEGPFMYCYTGRL